MQKIPRILTDVVRKAISDLSKVVIVYGPRQVGKTTLIRDVLESAFSNFIILNGEEHYVNENFSAGSLTKMIEATGNHAILFIDEAQNIKDIGKNIKILFDAQKDLKIILSGSSSLELANRLQEPMTGRKRVFHLFPVSLHEYMMTGLTKAEIRERLNSLLIYGMYPEVLQQTSHKEMENVIKELSTSYLYKDIIQLAGIRNHDKIHDLLRLLALQTGSTVSINKLANALNLSTHTIENYITLLEQSFVIFRVRGYSKNLAKEISKMDKIYFYDTGVRNAILNNFLSIANRNDNGALWENFIIAERRKFLEYNHRYVNTYFWRTYTGAEIDYVEESNGSLDGFEIKYNTKVKSAPSTWKQEYPEASFQTINLDTFFDYLMIC